MAIPQQFQRGIDAILNAYTTGISVRVQADVQNNIGLAESRADGVEGDASTVLVAEQDKIQNDINHWRQWILRPNKQSAENQSIGLKALNIAIKEMAAFRITDQEVRAAWATARESGRAFVLQETERQLAGAAPLSQAQIRSSLANIGPGGVLKSADVGVTQLKASGDPLFAKPDVFTPGDDEAFGVNFAAEEDKTRQEIAGADPLFKFVAPEDIPPPRGDPQIPPIPGQRLPPGSGDPGDGIPDIAKDDPTAADPISTDFQLGPMPAWWPIDFFKWPPDVTFGQDATDAFRNVFKFVMDGAAGPKLRQLAEADAGQEQNADPIKSLDDQINEAILNNQFQYAGVLADIRDKPTDLELWAVAQQMASTPRDQLVLQNIQRGIQAQEGGLPHVGALSSAFDRLNQDPFQEASLFTSGNRPPQAGEFDTTAIARSFGLGPEALSEFSRNQLERIVEFKDFFLDAIQKFPRLPASILVLEPNQLKILGLAVPPGLGTSLSVPDSSLQTTDPFTTTPAQNIIGADGKPLAAGLSPGTINPDENQRQFLTLIRREADTASKQLSTGDIDAAEYERILTQLNSAATAFNATIPFDQQPAVMSKLRGGNLNLQQSVSQGLPGQTTTQSSGGIFTVPSNVSQELFGTPNLQVGPATATVQQGGVLGPAGSAFSAVGIRTPSGQAIQNMTPPEREQFFARAQLEGLTPETIQFESRQGTITGGTQPQTRDIFSRRRRKAERPGLF